MKVVKFGAFWRGLFHIRASPLFFPTPFSFPHHPCSCQLWVLFFQSTHAGYCKCNAGGAKLEMCSLLCGQSIVTCNPFLLSLHLCICPLVSSSPTFLCYELPGQNLAYPLAIFKKQQTSELGNHTDKCLRNCFVIVLWKANLLNMHSLCYQVGTND